MPGTVGFARQRCRAFGGQDFKVGCVQTTAALAISGDAHRYNHRGGNDDYGQPRSLFNLFDAGVRAAIARKK